MSGIIAGASSFVNAATLANSRGFAASQASIFGNNSGLDAGGLLDVGRRINRNNGTGLSSAARRINRQFLQSSTANYNALFSLAIGTTSSIESLQTQILALRARTPASRLSRSVLELGTTTGSSSLDNAITEAQALTEAAQASGRLSGNSSSVLSGGSGSIINTSA